MKLVLDSSILIDHLRGGIVWKNLFDEIEQESPQIYIPTIVLFELFSGKSTHNADVVSKIENLVRDFHRIELTEEIAKHAGRIFRDLNRTFQVPDYIIAASALEIGASVLTLNTKHFKHIPNLSIYPL